MSDSEKYWVKCINFLTGEIIAYVGTPAGTTAFSNVEFAVQVADERNDNDPAAQGDCAWIVDRAPEFHSWLVYKEEVREKVESLATMPCGITRHSRQVNCANVVEDEDFWELLTYRE